MLRSLSLAVCLSLCAALAPLRTSEAATNSADASSGSALAEHMEGLKTNLKSLAMAVGGSDGEAALGHLAELQRLVLLAKLELPPNLDEQEPGEREAHRVRFRKNLVLVLQELADMELELLDGDFERAFGRITGSLFQLRESSHDAFKRSE